MDTFTSLYTASLTSHTTPAASADELLTRQVAAEQFAIMHLCPLLWATVHNDLHGCFAGRRDSLVAWQTVSEDAANLMVARQLYREIRAEFDTLSREIRALGVVDTHPLVVFGEAIATHPHRDMIAQRFAVWGGVAGYPNLLTEAIEEPERQRVCRRSSVHRPRTS